ncbi:MAG: pilin [Candidatus Nanogingivalaceae bacterium]|jgi:hypothetical protein cdivTM_30108|nr:MAG: pilin [Candidatus Nanogingivalaceae bacterium]QWB91612.1 MAG: pilin [Candidatus Nanogingivalaceae bacterium]
MKKILLAFGLIFAFATPIVMTSNVLDNQAHAEGAADLIQKGADSTGQKDSRSAGDLAKDFVNIMLFAVGILAVIMLIWGGIRYVLSGGDSGAVSSAKKTILYAVVGLIVAILAYAIVNFVITTIAKK